MLTASLLVLGLIGLGLVLVIPVLLRLFKPCPAVDILPDWLDNFEVSNYYPMRQLLATEDFQFLVRQPGFDLSLYKKLRQDRMLIYRQYMLRLIADFNRLHALARFVVARGTSDNSELLVRLLKLRLLFTLSVIRAEINFQCCRLGIGSLAAQSIIAGLEDMSAELGSLLNPNAA